MRSILTMLGIIIGIGSVISIVSIGDTMRAMFADLYKNVGLTQAYVSIGYWVDDTRQGDYFTLDEMEQVKEAFPDEIAYIDSSASASAKAVYKRTSIDFSYEGIDWNYQDVQPVNMVYGRYLNVIIMPLQKINKFITVHLRHHKIQNTKVNIIAFRCV